MIDLEVEMKFQRAAHVADRIFLSPALRERAQVPLPLEKRRIRITGMRWGCRHRFAIDPVSRFLFVPCRK